MSAHDQRPDTLDGKQDKADDLQDETYTHNGHSLFTLVATLVFRALLVLHPLRRERSSQRLDQEGPQIEGEQEERDPFGWTPEHPVRAVLS